jgi:hypothetical protein
VTASHWLALHDDGVAGRRSTMPRSLRIPLLALATALLLAACGSIDLLEATLEGRLLDVEGSPVAGAVVFVPEGVAGAALLQAVGCQAPSQPARASTCTDGDGRYALRISTPLLGSLRLVFERLYWRTEVEVELGLRIPGEAIEVPDARFEPLAPAEELEAAVRHALPSLRHFELITLNTGKQIEALLAHAADSTASRVPLHLRLPILQPDGSQAFVSWTAYHHDQREFGVADCAIDPVSLGDVDCQEVAGPSLTFQGMPALSPAEVRELFIGETEKNLEALQNELEYQLSTIAIIGGELDATYHGQALAAPHTPSSLQGLRSVLDVRYDPATVDRLLAGGGANYLLHNQIDLVDLGLEDVDLHLDALAAAPAAAVRPSSHFLEGGVKYLRPVMVADGTVYDAAAGVRLVPNYFARVDAMANRQDLFFALVQLSAQAAPASLTSLDAWSNAFSVRTRIAGYRRFTPAGQAGFAFPDTDCGAADSLIQAYQDRSRDTTTVDNEYWMWWTNTDRYPGTWGCAYVGRLHLTPRGGAVGWVSFRNYTLETVGQTFMHETGHLLNANHNGVAASQRCALLGIFPIGVTGPSIMGGTSDRNLRTNCFAVTPANATSLRNRTRIAEYLHLRLE